MKSQRTIILTLGSISFSLITTGIISVALPLYLDYLGITLVGIGFIFSLAPVISMIAKSVVAVHSDVVGRKGYFSLGLLLRSVSYCFYSICTIPVGFAILKTLDSLSQHFRNAVEMPLLVDISPKEKRGRILGAYWTILSVATAIGLFISGAILLLIGYFWLFILCSLISLLGLLLVQIAGIPTFKTKNVHLNLKKTFNFKELGWNLKVSFLSGFLGYFGYSLVESFAFPLFLQQEFRTDPILIGMAIGLGWVTSGVPAILWNKMTETHSPVNLYFLGCGVTGATTLLMNITPDLTTTVCLYMAGGFFWGFAGPAGMKVLADSAKSADRARDINLSRLGNGIGIMIGSAGSGIIAQTAGFRFLFIISGTFYLASALTFFSAIRGYK